MSWVARDVAWDAATRQPITLSYRQLTLVEADARVLRDSWQV
jgi:hypothetical protein